MCIRDRITGKLVKRRQFKDRSDAEKFAEGEYRGYRKQGQEFFSLTDQERREVAASMSLVRKHNISVGEAVRYAVKHIRP